MNVWKVLERLQGLDTQSNRDFWTRCNHALIAGVNPKIEMSNTDRLAAHSAGIRITLREELYIEFFEADGVYFLERSYVPWTQKITDLPHRIEDQVLAFGMFFNLLAELHIPLILAAA